MAVDTYCGQQLPFDPPFLPLPRKTKTYRGLSLTQLMKNQQNQFQQTRKKKKKGRLKGTGK
jgi:hypothetical protein